MPEAVHLTLRALGLLGGPCRPEARRMTVADADRLRPPKAIARSEGLQRQAAQPTREELEVTNMTRHIAMAALATVLLATAGTAQQPAGGDEALPKGFKTTPVLKSTRTASDMTILYPKAGQAEVVSVIGELEPGGRTSRHQHPVPVFVYVLDRTLTVQADGGQPREYAPGKAFIEDMNHWHQAFNKGTTPTRILVVFMAEEGKPTSINAK
jgi:quercetin dioxygenase-like cupin family protein